MGWDGFFTAVVDVEAGMFPGDEVGGAAGADGFALAQGVEETMVEEFDGRAQVFGGEDVEIDSNMFICVFRPHSIRVTKSS